MANEVSLTVRLLVKKPTTITLMDFSPGTLQFDMSGNNGDGHRIAVVPTTHGAVPIPTDVGTEGYAYFRNLDASNFIQIGVEVAATFYPLVKLKAGRVAVFPLAIQGAFWKADTATCRVQYGVVED